MPDGNSLKSGTVRFTNSSTVNGVFVAQDANSYVIQGELGELDILDSGYRGQYTV